MTHPQPSLALSADVVAQMPPILHEAVEQMISALSNRRSACIGDGTQPDMLCHAAAEMFRRLAAELAERDTELTRNQIARAFGLTEKEYDW